MGFESLANFVIGLCENVWGLDGQFGGIKTGGNSEVHWMNLEMSLECWLAVMGSWTICAGDVHGIGLWIAEATHQWQPPCFLSERIFMCYIRDFIYP